MYEMLWICIHGHKWIGLAYYFRSAKSSSFLAKAAHKEKELGLAENHVMIVNGLEVSFRICFFEFQWISMTFNDHQIYWEPWPRLQLLTPSAQDLGPGYLLGHSTLRIQRSKEHWSIDLSGLVMNSAVHWPSLTISDQPQFVTQPARQNQTPRPLHRTNPEELNVYFTWWNWM